ncbi:MAG: SUMF1/EgtB/PvdO family nonheme iron enzyme [Muribaculaceae bacterium]|nr:SUMF1/EgtB/PvdO family nonheme iron enzyme [Muribaculaceae bacterium]
MKYFKFSFIILIVASWVVTVTTGCNRSAKVAADSIMAHMVHVDGGTYYMGNDFFLFGGYDNERPDHKVTLKPFYICKYEVTQEEWEAIMGKNPSYYKDKSPRHPIESISWEDCQVFVKRLSKLTGKNFRLPTEAEWEFAARGGNKSKNYKYSGSNDAYEVGCIQNPEDQATQEVGMLHPNELGLYDMTGNVMEFCSDYYGSYSSEDQVNPKGPSSNPELQRVIRGGGWFNADYRCHVTMREAVVQNVRGNGVGLRVVMDAE